MGTVAWSVSDRKKYGIRTLICLFGSILFLIFIATAVYAKQTFGPPARAGALQSATAPAVIVNNIRVNPQRPKAGQVFEVWIDFFNKGKGPTKAGQKYYATCTPQNGGPPVWNPGPHPLEQIISPNQSVQVVFKGSIKDPGNYVLAIKPDPMASDVMFAKMITFTVDPLLNPQLKINPKPSVMQK